MPLVYNLINNGTEYEVLGGSSDAGLIKVPDIYLGKPVTKIVYEAFYTRTDITDLIIGNNVNYIGEYAFSECPNLKNISLSSNLISLERATFADCYNIEKITIPKSIIEIKEGCFAQCYALQKIFFEGNTPTFEAFVFDFRNPSLKLYRKKNFVTGWPSSIQGVPVVLWSDNIIKGGGSGKLIGKKRN